MEVGYVSGFTIYRGPYKAMVHDTFSPSSFNSTEDANLPPFLASPALQYVEERRGNMGASTYLGIAGLRVNLELVESIQACYGACCLGMSLRHLKQSGARMTVMIVRSAMVTSIIVLEIAVVLAIIMIMVMVSEED